MPHDRTHATKDRPEILIEKTFREVSVKELYDRIDQMQKTQKKVQDEQDRKYKALQQRCDEQSKEMEELRNENSLLRRRIQELVSLGEFNSKMSPNQQQKTKRSSFGMVLSTLRRDKREKT